MLVNEEQVFQFRRLNRFLRRLRIIGLLNFQVVSVPLSEYGKPYRYQVKIESYEPDVFYGKEEEMDDLMKKYSHFMLAFDESYSDAKD